MGKKKKSRASSDDGVEESVKVAVRVRPFNKRERERNAKLIVSMTNNQTMMQDPDNPNDKPKMFAFDHSYWSHDGGKERADGYWEPDPSHPNSSNFCDQQQVFNDLGQGLLKNAWEGYNSTLFAYGQTGSGKSYSVVGYEQNKGIVPLLCEKLFQDIDKKKGGEEKFEVTFSMLEIYNEIVRDLLVTNAKKKGLRVRQHPKKGFFPEGLSIAPVDSYKAIEKKMAEGTTNRTIASTNMNATSSRAHTIVGITFVQKRKNAAGQEVSKSSVVNLVDLAGSERVSSTGATGDRLKEGAAINQSLSALGNVISALADNSNGKKVKVPYRDSVLTQLLMNALGGNSKTIMIAAISPADINYEESLSTLRYADRAKQIKTKAVVNEDPTDKLIRELQEENERLKKMKGGGGAVMSAEEEDDYKAQLEENEREMEEMRKSFEEKLRQAQALDASSAGSMASSADSQRYRDKYPHIYNLNMDPQLNAMIVHPFKAGAYKIGNQKGSASEIVMKGPSILEQHATVTTSKDFMTVTLTKAQESARIMVNGSPLVGSMALHHNDRILFGSTQLYVFGNPYEVKKSPKKDFGQVNWEMAQQEIAGHSGFDMNRGTQKSQKDLLLQEALLDVMPAIEEANSISESLDRMVKFEMVLVAPEALGKNSQDMSEVYIRVRNFANGLQFEWPKEKFMNRFYKMQELYEDVEEGEVKLSELKESEDPFTEPTNAPIRIGTCCVYLKNLAYCIDMKNQLEITDIRGNEVGLMNTEVCPCDTTGKEYTEASNVWIDDPNELIGKDLNFKFKLNSVRGLPPRFTDVFCKYKVLGDAEHNKTPAMAGTMNPDFKHAKMFAFKPVDKQKLQYLMDGRILVETWGRQVPQKVDTRGGSTRDLLQADNLSRSMISAANSNQKVVDVSRTKSDAETVVLKKRQEKMEGKLHCLRQMLNQGVGSGKDSIPLNYVKGVLDAPSADVMQKWVDMFTDSRVDGMTNGHIRSNSAPIDNNNKSSSCVIS